ncbi:MAG: trigger factor [Hydrococcus sp. C42_A2020_068]|uniref:trigger factor n=1 Tax=Pleurocapsa sp. PCC 7327 TaxID=118163 RepID=UPI00029FF347|nr:trigger factor [Pleurocapsa sp. PCC 7327]AFY76431.1 trigger factor [Pleurocapsa sp. PCC 7327]MBF2018766.1 trigger factor [Hydrococcus sp. C42_A2020_068]
MKVTQEKLPDSQIGLEIEISAETSKNTYEKVIQNLARSSNIPGFRKGKVPRQVLLQRIGSKQIKAAALEEIVQKALEEAIKQESIESLGNYKLRSNFDELIQKYEPGEPLTFSASVDVPPTVELGQYQGLTVKAEESVYDPKEIEDWLEQRRIQQATLVPVEERGAQMGDVAIVDYQGRTVTESGEAGEPIPGVQGTDLKVEMEQGRFIEGMVEGIVGMKPEETKEISVTFPEDYPREDLAGKAVIFSITLKELKAKELPELDDDFAQEVSEFETMAQLRESLEKQYREKAKQETKNSIRSAIIAELLKNCTVDLPDTMIQEEVNAILTQTAMQMQQLGVDIKQLFNAQSIPRMRENSRPEAIERLKQTLILKEIAKVESIESEAEAVEAKIKELREKFSDREIDLERLRDMVQEDLLVEKTLDWLEEKTTVELVPKGTLEEAAKSEEEGTEAASTQTEEE